MRLPPMSFIGGSVGERRDEAAARVERKRGEEPFQKLAGLCGCRRPRNMSQQWLKKRWGWVQLVSMLSAAQSSLFRRRLSTSARRRLSSSWSQWGLVFL